MFALWGSKLTTPGFFSQQSTVGNILTPIFHSAAFIGSGI